jgi:hypothetical protein
MTLPHRYVVRVRMILMLAAGAAQAEMSRQLRW